MHIYTQCIDITGNIRPLNHILVVALPMEADYLFANTSDKPKTSVSNLNLLNPHPGQREKHLSRAPIKINGPRCKMDCEEMTAGSETAPL